MRHSMSQIKSHESRGTMFYTIKGAGISNGYLYDYVSTVTKRILSFAMSVPLWWVIAKYVFLRFR